METTTTTNDLLNPADSLFETSPSIAKLADALSKAQAEIKGAVKDSTNPHFGSKYADLEAVWDACRDPLTKNGLAVVQVPVTEGAGVTLVTMLMHTSGEWLRGKFRLNPARTDPQGMGSALTYGRRYALAGFAGVNQTDDDGNASSANAPDRKPKSTAPKEDKNVTKQVNKPPAKPFNAKGKVVQVAVKEFQGQNEVWLKFKTADGEPICFTGTDDAMSRLLEAEGQNLELVLMESERLHSNKPMYSIHQIVEAA